MAISVRSLFWKIPRIVDSQLHDDKSAQVKSSRFLHRFKIDSLNARMCVSFSVNLNISIWWISRKERLLRSSEIKAVVDPGNSSLSRGIQAMNTSFLRVRMVALNFGKLIQLLQRMSQKRTTPRNYLGNSSGSILM